MKISFFYPDLKMLYLCFRLCFHLSQANNSYSSYIFSNLTFFCVDDIFLFSTCLIWVTATYGFFTQISFLFSPFSSKQLIFFLYFLISNYLLLWWYFSFVYRSNMGHCDIWFFLPRFHFYFQLSKANSSYSSYIYFDLTICCVDGIDLLITGLIWVTATYDFFTHVSFLFSPFSNKQLIFFLYFLISNYLLRWWYFSFFYRSNMGHRDIWFFYPDFVFIFSFLKQTAHILLIFTLI